MQRRACTEAGSHEHGLAAGNIENLASLRTGLHSFEAAALVRVTRRSQAARRAQDALHDGAGYAQGQCRAPARRVARGASARRRRRGRTAAVPVIAG